MTKKFFKIIIALEVISLLGFFIPLVREAGMVIFALLAFYLIYRHNEYAIYLAITELIIGSKGHLLFIELAGQIISLRIALWLIILLVWIIKVVIDIKNKKFENLQYLNNYKYFKYLFIIFLFSVVGAVNGYLKGNNLGNLINDFNAWLYFLLIFPFYYFFKNIKNEDLKEVVIAAIIWSSIKTLFLLFIFSHDSGLVVQKIYRWVRVTGVGEITKMKFGFFRIFFQSHIYQTILFFPVIFHLSSIADFQQKINQARSIFKNFDYLKIVFFLVLLWMVTILSLSRSNWLGLVIGLALLLIIFLRQRKFNEIINIAVVLSSSLFISIFLIFFVINFPIPNQSSDLDLFKTLSDRLAKSDNESAISSRWELLPAIWREIWHSPILGEGFGSTVTYKSSDPRVLERSPGGKYTTFAFEWGWLDIWLKIGFFGALIYLLTIFLIIKDGLRSEKNINNGLAVSLIILTVINFFSPYLNHPLGIGFILITTLLINREQRSCVNL